MDYSLQFKDIVPPGAVLTWSKSSDPAALVGGTSTIHPLFNEELALIDEASSNTYRTQFRLGRLAAHQAMEKLGHSPTPVGRGARRMPLFAAGLVGSISHTGDIGCCLLGLQSKFLALGIDIEHSDRQISNTLKRQIGGVAEFELLANAGAKTVALVCAKEALFKCLFPLVSEFFGFQDARLKRIASIGAPDQGREHGRDAQGGPEVRSWEAEFEIQRDLGFAGGGQGAVAGQKIRAQAMGAPHQDGRDAGAPDQGRRYMAGSLFSVKIAQSPDLTCACIALLATAPKMR